MTAASDIIHQIEYRWHDRRDLSPIASTMSPDSLRGWDSWIRTWVRHPHVEGLGESVCYQVQSSGRAALAWRYEDEQVADRADAARGRPLVSRVLVGQVSQLTPEVAIALCHTRLREWAGPPPGRVGKDADLTGVAADVLTRLARDQVAGLDLAAAAQRDCLRRILAPALADSRTPIAVHLPDADILKPPDKGLPCLLLWGLWRIARPVLGTGSRGWSFSTFELPPGDADPATLPDILFRQAQYTPRAVARPREELKLRPFEPKPADEADEFAEMATWLLAEFQESGGDGLRKFVEGLQGADKSVQPRISRIYEELHARRAPAIPPGPVTPPTHRLPGPQWQRSEPRSEPARVQPVIVEPVRVEPERVEPEPVEPEPVEPEPVLERPPTSAEPPPTDEAPEYEEWQESVGKHRAADPQKELTPGRSQRRQAPARRLAVNVLLKKLPEAEKNSERFHDIVRDILDERNPPEFDDRHLSRREISKPDWYTRVRDNSHHDALIDLLAAIFEVIIIPDLDLPEVIGKITEWVEGADPPVIGGLLVAAKQSGDDSSRKMMEVVQPRLAFRWMLEKNMDDLWYTVAAPPKAVEPNRSGWFNFLGRN